MSMPRLFLAIVAGILSIGSLNAAEAPLPSPGDVKALAVYPTKVALVGSDAVSQLIVTATLGDGRLVDLTQDVKYLVADSKSSTILSTGRVLPKSNGTTEI